MSTQHTPQRKRSAQEGTRASERLASPSDFNPNLRDSLERMAEVSDRTPPVAFVGREDEIALLDEVVRGVQRGDVGRTVVVQGVPGAGKTALKEQYIARALSQGTEDDLVIPVPLRPDDLQIPPLAMVELVDRCLLKHGGQGTWMQTANRAAAAGGIAVNVLIASMTKKPFRDFTPASSAPDSFDLALNEYATFRFGAKKATFLLLLDEAQNVLDTPRAKSYLSVLHMGMDGVKVALACFGLADTTKRLNELGLSRLASGHVRTLGMLSNDESEKTVRKTLEKGLAKFTFDYGPSDEDERTKWIAAATNAILEASANFPHHLANGCKALGRILLEDGVLREPPVDRLRQMCSERRREYYDARLESWRNHKTALAYGFGTGDTCKASVEDVEKALMAVDEYGKPVPSEEASSVVLGLHDKGLIEVEGGECRLLVPSMATYFREIRSDDTKPIVKTLQAALSTSNQQRRVG